MNETVYVEEHPVVIFDDTGDYMNKGTGELLRTTVLKVDGYKFRVLYCFSQSSGYTRLDRQNQKLRYDSVFDWPVKDFKDSDEALEFMTKKIPMFFVRYPKRALPFGREEAD